jgi:hypothetical protein
MIELSAMRFDEDPVFIRIPVPLASRISPLMVDPLTPGATSTPLSKPRMIPLRIVMPVRF